MSRAKPSMALDQGRFITMDDMESEVLLELTIPIVQGERLFRVGWSLKALRSRGFIAITTGETKWDIRRLEDGSRHVLHVLEACVGLTNGWYDNDGVGKLDL